MIDAGHTLSLAIKLAQSRTLNAATLRSAAVQLAPTRRTESVMALALTETDPPVLIEVDPPKLVAVGRATG